MTAPFNMASVGPILKIFLEQQQASPKPERITAKTKIEMDPISRAIAQLRKVGYTDQQLMMVRTNAQHQTQAITDLRKAGWTDDDLLGLGRAMSGAWQMQAPPQQGIRQAPHQQRAVPEMRSAQPGQTRVTPQMVQQQQMGQVRQWAAQQANDPRAVGGMVADMLPVIGDIKAGFDAVAMFKRGNILAGSLALASILPGVPNVPGKGKLDDAAKVMRDGREVPYGVTTVPTIKRAIEKVGADTFKREVEFTGLIRDWNMDNPLEAAIAVEETARRIDLGALGREKPWLWQHNAPEIIKERAKRFSMGEK